MSQYVKSAAVGQAVHQEIDFRCLRDIMRMLQEPGAAGGALRRLLCGESRGPAEWMEEAAWAGCSKLPRSFNWALSVPIPIQCMQPNCITDTELSCARFCHADTRRRSGSGEPAHRKIFRTFMVLLSSSSLSQVRRHRCRSHNCLRPRTAVSEPHRAHSQTCCIGPQLKRASLPEPHGHCSKPC